MSTAEISQQISAMKDLYDTKQYSNETIIRQLTHIHNGEIPLAEGVLRQIKHYRTDIASSVDAILNIESLIQYESLNLLFDKDTIGIQEFLKNKELLNQLMSHYQTNIDLWNEIPEFREIINQSPESYSKKNAVKWLISLSPDQIAKIKRMEVPILELFPDIPYSKLIPAANQFFKSKGLNEIDIHEDTEAMLNRGDRDRLIFIEKGKIFPPAAWGAVEGADNPVMKFADGTEDDYRNSDWGRRYARAQQEAGPKMNYAKYIYSQMVRAQKGELKKGNKVYHRTILDGTYIHNGSVSCANWSQSYRRVYCLLQYAGTQYTSYRLRAVVM